MYRKRLKNVYELLEAGNNKKVIQEVDKLIETNAQSKSTVVNKKKQIVQLNQHLNEPGFDENVTLIIAKALKSLALHRTSRKQDADRLIDELLDSYTTDENALSIIMQYCKETQQLHKLVTFYENAVEKCQSDPNLIGTNEHEEILCSLFYAYVRNRDFAKQQQIALKLYKQTNKMMYCFWNAASYAMIYLVDVIEKTNLYTPQQKQMYMQLGEKILQKAYDEQKMEYSGEFLLFLNILEEKNKHSEALKIVEAFNEELNASKIGQINFRIKKKIAYFKKLKQWKDVKSMCEQHISDSSNANLDDWLTYLDYINALSNIFTELTNLEERNTFITLTQDFFSDLITREKVQAPYLARIEFLNRILQIDQSTAALDKYKNQIEVFFSKFIENFVSKPGFYFEMSYFRKFIKKLNLSEFILNKLKEEHDRNRPFKNIKSIYACLSYWQLHRSYGLQKNLSSKELIALAVSLEEMYTEALEYGKDLLSTGFQFADEFLILAVHLRYDAFKNDEYNPNKILELITNLKHGLIQSPSNYQLKLLLLNLYSHLGAYDALQSMYHQCEIKNIQNYSTANLLLVHAIRLGGLGTFSTTSTAMEQFFLSNLFDMANFLVNCYKYGNFLKAVEICTFMNAIRRSLSLSLCLCNSFATTLMTHSMSEHSSSSTNQDQADEEIIMSYLKGMHSKLDTHLKEIGNVSNAFDSNSGLLPDEDEKLAECLLDHNDKNVLYNWEPEDDEELGNKQYNLVIDEQRRLLKLRNLMSRYANAMFKIMLLVDENLENNIQVSNLNLYKKKLLEFDYKFLFDKENKERAEDESYFDSRLKIYVTKSAYLRRWSELGLNEILTVFIQVTSELFDMFYSQEQEKKVKSSFSTQRDQFKKCAKTGMEKINKMLELFKIKNEFSIQSMAKILEYFSSSLECISYVSLLLTLCLSSQRLKPMWTEKVKKSKKKKGQYAQYSDSIDVLFELYETLCQLVNFYLVSLKQFICPNILILTQAHIQNIPTTIKIIHSMPTVSNAFFEDIGQSYVKSFDELKNNFGTKLKYLLKFSGNTTIQLTSDIENLKLN